jgi:hypothetical protein
MKKLKLYIETSVWNFLFANDSPERRNITLRFFEDVRKGDYELFISDMVIAEICDAPAEKRRILLDAIDFAEPEELKVNDEIKSLTEKYIGLGIIPERYERDLVHIAFATVFEMDVLISWNLKHIVKMKTQTMVNEVNEFSGYMRLNIMTPEAVIEIED